jgi:hypothetical protein
VTCKDQNLECVYKDTHPTKADKNNQLLSDTLIEVLTSVKAMSERLGDLEKHVTGRSLAPARVDTPNGSSQTDMDSTSLAVRNDGLEEWNDAPDDPEDLERDQGDHTTAAHKLLLRWPSIQPFIRTSKCKVQEDYVMKGEDRGLLRLYGAGERDEDDKVAIGAASPAGSSNGEGAISPETDPRRSEPYTPGSPNVAIDNDTIDHLFASYKKNIHRLHPFIDIDSLGRYLKEFQRKHCGEVKQAQSPMFVSNTGTGERDSKRRKRSDFCAFGMSPAEQSLNSAVSSPSKPAPERTLINAIVYLVLALGRICDAKDILAGPVQEISSAKRFGRTQVKAVSPNTQPSPSSPSLLFNNLANSSAGITRSQSWDGAGSQPFDRRPIQNPQNVDKIPGLGYYREACSILGDFSDSNELACAQACLLAALYKGQLARVQESWSWINLAARSCLYRMKM